MQERRRPPHLGFAGFAVLQESGSAKKMMLARRNIDMSGAVAGGKAKEGLARQEGSSATRRLGRQAG